jgi:lipid A 4'-phosphatase
VRRRAALLLALVTAVALGLFLVFPELDLAVGRGMTASDGRFLLAGSRLFTILHLATPYWVGLCIGYFVAAALAQLIGRPIAGLGVWQALYVVAVFVIGPGLLANALLKEHSGRPRPQDVLQFQGSYVYAAPFAFDGACEHNCSFVAGEPSAAFALVGPALLLAPRWRRAGMAGALIFGVLIGLLRMYQGGHFLSDVVFAGILSVATALGLHWLMFDAKGRPRWPAKRQA